MARPVLRGSGLSRLIWSLELRHEEKAMRTCLVIGIGIGLGVGLGLGTGVGLGLGLGLGSGLAPPPGEARRLEGGDGEAPPPDWYPNG